MFRRLRSGEWSGSGRRCRRVDLSHRPSPADYCVVAVHVSISPVFFQQIRTLAPRAGADTVATLRNTGYSFDEIDNLRQFGVI